MIKKEEYFTKSNKASITEELISGLKSGGYFRELPAKIEAPALLILDMQNFFLDPASSAFIPSGPAIVKNIQGIISSFRENGLPLIFTRHVNTERDAGRMASWWRKMMLPGPATEIIPGLNSTSENIIDKTQYDPFYNTGLEDMLKKLNVKTLILTGVMTHLCVESAARSAFVRGFEVIIPSDAVATYNLELHRGSLHSIAHGFGYITDSKTLAGKIADGE